MGGGAEAEGAREGCCGGGSYARTERRVSGRVQEGAGSWFVVLLVVAIQLKCK